MPSAARDETLSAPMMGVVKKFSSYGPGAKKSRQGIFPVFVVHGSVESEFLS
jgi:hypothetical protein